MKTKAIALLLVVVVAATLFAGCGSKNAKSGGTDVVTTASLVNDATAFEKAIGKDGTWIVCTLGDLKIDKELVVEGEFRDKGDATKDLYRKLGLYAQDDKRNVTARYTLTAPKLTVKSPNFKIQGGTFVGDVYVDNNGFNLTDATIQGNLYFTKQEYKDSAKIDTGKVTGTTEVK